MGAIVILLYSLRTQGLLWLAFTYVSDNTTDPQDDQLTACKAPLMWIPFAALMVAYNTFSLFNDSCYGIICALCEHIGTEVAAWLGGALAMPFVMLYLWFDD